ncbi:MAG: tail fiber domain-containing protein [Thermoflexales bacterium]|nr:tail fiber domain-containing protein [Thermoflexales bacterium]
MDLKTRPVAILRMGLAVGLWLSCFTAPGGTAYSQRSPVAEVQDDPPPGRGSTIGGGLLNQASGWYVTIGGGERNTAPGSYATVGGGGSNTASGGGAAVGGGLFNQASGGGAAIGGGKANSASGDYAAVPGGEMNNAGGDYSLAAGRRAGAGHPGVFVWGDSTDADINSGAPDQFIVRASGGVWFGGASGAYTPSLGSGQFVVDAPGGVLLNGGPIRVNGAYTLPSRDGKAGQVLQTDGMGKLAWASAGTTTQGEHAHDERYYTRGELEASLAGKANSSHTHAGNEITSPVPTATTALRAAQAPWDGLTQVPAGLDDGDDDTLNSLACGSGQLAKWDGAAWTCADDSNDDTLDSLACGSGQPAKWDGKAWACADDIGAIYQAGAGLKLQGTAFSLADAYRLPQACAGGEISRWDGSAWICTADEDTDTDSLASLACRSGEVAKWNGSAWACAADQDVAATYSAGQGLQIKANTIDLNFGATAGTVARGDHAHDDRYYTVTELDKALAGKAEGAHTHTGGEITSPVPTATLALVALQTAWDALVGVPRGFADGLDDTDDLVSWLEISDLVGSGAQQVAAGDHQHDTRYWTLTGNSSTVYGEQFLGTTEPVSLTLKVHNTTALRLAPGAHGGTPNLIGGYEGNAVSSSVMGSAIAGGGAAGGVNRATADYVAIGGGWDNSASADAAAVGGGQANRASGAAAAIGGGYANTAAEMAAAIGGGWNNTATAGYSAVSGGRGNTASGEGAAVGGGQSNTASGQQAALGGGESNTAAGQRSVVGGGWGNQATESFSAVGGGVNNTTSGYAATVGGGLFNRASAFFATVPGGNNNEANGAYSLAAGYRAKANNPGCFVWGDSFDGDVACNGDNRWIARASGGVYFYTNGKLTSGMYLAAGGSSWNAVSDRERKENFKPIDKQALLERLAEIPITTWNYTAQDSSIRHIGPTAQDFNALLPELGGEGERYINSLDADGVALAAIQGLHEQLKEQQAQLDTLAAENTALQRQNEALEARLSALEAHTAHSSPSPLASLPIQLGIILGMVCVGGIVVKKSH